MSRAALQSSGGSVNRNEKVRADFVPGEILVRFRSRKLAKDNEQNARTLYNKGRVISINIERVEGSELVEGLRLARVAPEETLQAVAALNEQADVLYAEPNYVRRKDATAPNDTRYAEQWGLKNTGQLISGIGNGTAGADIKAEQ
ncbi:MAG: hypothetical protein ICV68_10155, partial [Pyrinomonadaceae bacterium]|nr:hypothetical protein [Pyrinomonadaceae bacterium]